MTADELQRLALGMPGPQGLSLAGCFQIDGQGRPARTAHTPDAGRGDALITAQSRWRRGTDGLRPSGSDRCEHDHRDPAVAALRARRALASRAEQAGSVVFAVVVVTAMFAFAALFGRLDLAAPCAVAAVAHVVASDGAVQDTWAAAPLRSPAVDWVAWVRFRASEASKVLMGIPGRLVARGSPRLSQLKWSSGRSRRCRQFRWVSNRWLRLRRRQLRLHHRACRFMESSSR